MTQPAAPSASSIPSPDEASSHPIIVAIQAEVRKVVEQPLTQKNVRRTIELLEHAAQLIQSLRGAPAKRPRRGGNPVMTQYVANGGDEFSPDDLDLPSTAYAPVPETMGTHAFREIIALAADIMKPKEKPARVLTPQEEASNRALAVENISRAIQATASMPEPMRAATVEALKRDLERVLEDAPRAIVEAAAEESAPSVAPSPQALMNRYLTPSPVNGAS